MPNWCGWLVAVLQGLLLCMPAIAAPAGGAGLQVPGMAWVLASDALQPPAADDPRWQRVALPDNTSRSRPDVPVGPTWYRIDFAGPVPPPGEDAVAAVPWAVCLPYLHNGGALWLDGQLLRTVLASQPGLNVRWERPHLVPLPPALGPQTHHLMVRVVPGEQSTTLRFPRPRIGPLPTVQAVHDARLFWVRTMPQITVVVCTLGAGITLFISWRRRSEVLYGLFGVALLLWAVRTMTFVLEVLPSDEWAVWRVLYHAATGGVVVVLALLSMRFAGLRQRWVERLLVAYAVIGPLWIALQGAQADVQVGRLWGAGLMPIGLGALLTVCWAALRRRDAGTRLLQVAMFVAMLAGVHDYVVAYDMAQLPHWMAAWAEKRMFLLHHGANLLLLVIGVLLTQRFVESLDAVETLNHTLEDRVAAREAELAANYQRLAVLQGERAALEERRRIMRDLHDGLGSRLFTSLSRAERGVLQVPDLTQLLRDCIADMRLSLEALSSHDVGLASALADFLYRWAAVLEEAGVQPTWRIDVPEEMPSVSASATLQLLRLLQEALTNVLKHAGARRVTVTLTTTEGRLHLQVEDDGRGLPCGRLPNGRGMANMQARAQALGARLDVVSPGQGTRLSLEMRLPG